MFALLRRKKEKNQVAERLYEAVIKQSRQPVFYELYGVPDTTTGRFDLMCLHAFLVMDRLHDEGKQGEKLAQALFDRMFREMDLSLREMGIGDLGVPKHMKRMMKGFNGRAISYQKAIREDDPSKLVETVQRNLYGSVSKIEEDHAKIIALYMHESTAHLKSQSWEVLAQGCLEFKTINYEESEDGRKNITGMAA